MLNNVIYFIWVIHMRKNIISLSGDLASGKSTISKVIANKLSYEIYSNGEYFRTLAKEYNMSLEEFGEYVKKHPEIDEQIENSAKEYAKDHDNFVIDARLGFYAVPESFKIYLKVDIDEAAKRAFNDQKRKDVENFSSVEEHKKALISRFKLENERYFNLYGIHKDDMSNYDLVIDTTDKTPEEIVKIIIDCYKKWQES